MNAELQLFAHDGAIRQPIEILDPPYEQICTSAVAGISRMIESGDGSMEKCQRNSTCFIVSALARLGLEGEELQAHFIEIFQEAGARVAHHFQPKPVPPPQPTQFTHFGPYVSNQARYVGFMTTNSA